MKAHYFNITIFYVAALLALASCGGSTSGDGQVTQFNSPDRDANNTELPLSDIDVTINLNYTTGGDSTLVVDLATYFYDSVDYRLLSQADLSLGSASLSENGIFTYQSAGNVTGGDSILVRAIKSDSLKMDGRISINVVEENNSSSINYTIDKILLTSGGVSNIHINDADLADSDLVDLQVMTSFFSVSVDGNHIQLTADNVERYTNEDVVIIATHSNGEVHIENISLGVFPGRNAGKGWSLQGQHNDKHINLVVMGDGYREEDKIKFFNDIQDFIYLMENDSGIGPYMSAWSVHGVFTPSIDSGVNSGENENSKSTYFKSYYNCANIQRLICTDNTKVFNVANQEYPEFDTVVMIVNDARYGGSGGRVSVFSAGQPQIALHELGHTFAGLADEYVDSAIAHRYSPSEYVEGTFPNISAKNNSALVPWKHWVDEQAGVGVFEGGLYNALGFYRPNESSIMKSIYSPFGVVNSEIWVRNIYEKVNPISAYLPKDNVVSASSSVAKSFSIELPFDLPIQTVRWYLNNRELTHYRDAVLVHQHFDTGVHELKVVVDDTQSVREWGAMDLQRRNVWRVEVNE